MDEILLPTVDVRVSRRHRAWLCRLNWHAWSTWHISHVAKYPGWFDWSSQQRRCTACGKYQESLLK